MLSGTDTAAVGATWYGMGFLAAVCSFCVLMCYVFPRAFRLAALGTAPADHAEVHSMSRCYQISSGVAILFFYLPPLFFLAFTDCMPLGNGFVKATIATYGVLGGLFFLRSVWKNCFIRTAHYLDALQHFLA